MREEILSRIARVGAMHAGNRPKPPPDLPEPGQGKPPTSPGKAIKHSSFWGALAGAAVGALIAAAAFTVAAAAVAGAVALTGITGGAGLALVVGVVKLAVGFGAVFALGDLIGGVTNRVSAMVDSASPSSGAVKDGSKTVFVEGNPVSRAEIDAVLCDKHNGPQLIAQGSATVFVDGYYAARVGDKTVCGATIKEGASTVFFGSGQESPLTVADEFSGWEKALILAVEFLVPPSRGLFRGLGTLFTKGPMAVLRGMKAGAAHAMEGLRSAVECAKKGFRENKGLARASESIRGFLKDPVYIASGEVIEKRLDLELGQTVPLLFERTYRSGSPHTGLLGHGWHDSWSEVATVGRTEQGDIHVTLTLAQGYDIDFTFVVGATVVYCAEYPEFKLVKRHNGFHLWHRDSQTWRAFTVKQGDQLLLSAITDNHRNRIDFMRDPKGYLRKIRHSDGIELLLVWQGEFLRQVQRIDGGQKTVMAEYRQDEQGRLVEADAAHAYHLFYDYDSHHRLIRWHDNDQTWARYEYDHQGRCVYTTCADGYLTAHFEYLADRVVMTDGLGQRHEYGFNDLYLMAWEKSPLGHITRYEYDDVGNLLQEISPAGRVVEFAYLDNSGLVSTFTDGSGHQWHYDYDHYERLTGITDPLGRSWAWQYDSKGNPLSLTGPDASEVRFAWNRYGLLTEVSDEQGRTQASLFYDHRQRLMSATDAESRTQQLRYDQQDRLTTWTRPDGATYRLGYRRASWKLPEQLLRPDDKQEQRQYDKHNNLLNYTDGNGAVWRQTYGPFDLLMSRTDAEGRTWRYDYDKESQQLVCVTAPDGNQWQWWLDADARVIRERDMAGTETHYGYDEDGHCISIRNGEGETRHLLYDGRGLLIRETAPDDTLYYRYDAAGRLTEVTSTTSHIQLEYDERDRVVQERNSGTAIRRHYQGESHTVTRSLYWEGEEDSTALTSTFRYSATGELRQVQLPDGAELTLAHDSAGRESSRQSQAGFMQHREYDAMGWLTREMSGQAVDGRLQPTQTREYLYDGAGNLTGTRRNREAAGYQLDASGRVLSVLSGGAGRSVNTEEQYRYTRSGLPQDSTRLTEWQAGRLIQQDNTHYQYDKAGRLIRKQVVLPGYRPKVWHYRWDSRNQLRVVDTPAGERWFYRYDPFGRRIGKRCDQTHEDIRYLWDGDQIAEVRHDRDGDLVSRRHWIHRGWELLVQQRQNTDGSWETDFVTSGHNGEPQAIFNPQGEIRWQAPRTNLWGQRYTDNAESLDPGLAFAGQYRDAESSLCYNRFRYYDPSGGCYISPDPIGVLGGDNNYGYVPNPVGGIDPLGLAGCKLRGTDGRFRRAQNVQEEISGLPNFKDRTPGKIRQTLRGRGYSSVQAHSGGEVWTKGLPDGNTVSVRIDPANPRSPSHYADAVPHVHIETVPTSSVSNGNYRPRDVTGRHTATGGISDRGTNPNHNADVHIPMSPGNFPYN